jgi:hypothetical protein
VKPFGVRAAVSEGTGHAHEEAAVNVPVGVRVVEDASDAAHERLLRRLDQTGDSEPIAYKLHKPPWIYHA